MAVQAEAPSYGYDVDEKPDCITITIHHRNMPKGLGVTMGCGYIMGFIGVPIFGGWFGTIFTPHSATGGIFGAVVSLMGYGLLVCKERGKIKETLEMVAVIIDPRNVTINQTAYSRDHINSWTTRWTEGGSVVMANTNSIGSIVGGAAANASMRQQEKNSYAITFDYGDKTINIAQGLTEAKAARIMEAIQRSLQKLQ